MRIRIVKGFCLYPALAIFILIGLFLALAIHIASIELSLGLLVAAIVSVPGLGRLIYKRDIFDPLVLMTLLFVIAVPSSILYILNDPDSSLATVFGTVPLTVLNKAVLLSSLSMACLVTGFYFAAYLSPRRKENRCDDRTRIIPDFIVNRLIKLYWITVVIRLATLSSFYGTFFVQNTIGLDPLANLKAISHSFNYIAYLLAILATFFNGDRRYFKRGLQMSIMQLVIGLLIGSKAAGLLSLIPLAFAYNVSRKNMRNSIWPVAAILIFAFLFTSTIFPIISTYRSIATNPDLETFLFINRAGPLTDITLSAVLGRISWLPSIAKVIMAVPQFIPFAYGETIWPAFVWFVPRVIWSNKPVLSIGTWYAHEILGWDPSNRSEAAITLWGEAYINFGVLGMIFAGLSLGLLFWNVYAFLYKDLKGFFKIIIYFLFISTFILSFERNIASLIASFGQSLLISFIIWRLVSIKFKNKFEKIGYFEKSQLD